MKVSKSTRKPPASSRGKKLSVAIDAIGHHISPKLTQARATVMSAILALEKRGGVDEQLALSLRFGVLQPLDGISVNTLAGIARWGAKHG